MVRTLFALLLSLSPALQAREARLDVDAQPGTAVLINLPELTKLTGPYALASGPSWLSLNSAGILAGTPGREHLGDNVFGLEVKSGAVWLPLQVVVKVRYFRYGVKIFAAPWCTSCLEKVPALHQQMQLLAAEAGRLDVELYVTTGELPTDKPTQAHAEDFAKKLGTPTFKAKADAWRWTEYRKYFPTGYYLPAAAVVDEKGQLVRALPYAEFQPSTMVSYLGRLLAMGAVGGQPLDILVVGDNSGSMGPHQSAARAALPSFFSSLQKRYVDWRLGLVSAEVANAPFVGFVSPLGSLTSGALDLFRAAWDRLGTAGSATEQPFDVALKHLEATPQTFLRKDASLAVVWVTDEDDQSTTSVADYLRRLKALKAGAPVSHLGLLAAREFGAGCDTGAFTYKGSRLEQVISQGPGKVFSLCRPDLNAAMDELVAALSLGGRNR